MITVEPVSSNRLRQRFVWARMYIKYAVKSLFGPHAMYQVVIRVSEDGKREDVLAALDALRKAYADN